MQTYIFKIRSDLVNGISSYVGDNVDEYAVKCTVDGALGRDWCISALAIGRILKIDTTNHVY